MYDWRGAGRCSSDPDPWFPEGRPGFPDKRTQEAWAVAECGRCAVLDLCRAETAAVEETLPFTRWHGVSGGETAAERVARVKRERAARAATA